MNDQTTYAGKTDGLQLALDDIYEKAWDNCGGEQKNLLGILPGMAVVDRAGQVLARMTANGPETFCGDILPLPVMGSDAEDALMSVPVGAFRVVVEDPALDRLKVELLGVNLTVDLTTTARAAEVSVDDETGIAFAWIEEAASQYSLEFLNTLAGDAEKTLLTGITGQQKLQVVQKDGRLYGAGLTEQTSLQINDLPAPLTVIRQLEQQTQC
jgi:hypothetical protein